MRNCVTPKQRPVTRHAGQRGSVFAAGQDVEGVDGEGHSRVGRIHHGLPRLSDAVDVVRGEALVGLARLRDEGAIDFIVEALRSPHVLELVFEAGEELLTVYPDNSRLKAALANWRPD